MTEKYKLAQKDYEAGMKYKDIAAKYDVKLNTVKSWKSRYWNKGAPPQKSVHTKHKKVAHKVASNSDDLNPQQEIFAQLVAGQRIPMYRAYQIAYKDKKPTIATAMTNSSVLAKKPNVALRITKISKESAVKHEWSLDKVVESLSFLHDEAKADVIQNGLKKSNADALLESSHELIDLLGLKGTGDLLQAQVRKASAEAEVAEWKANELTNKNKSNDKTVLVDDIGGNTDAHSGS